jgi:hypothetical protein
METDNPIPNFLPRMRLYPEDDGQWVVRDGEREVCRHRWDDMRFSISWKAYCFRDQAERDAWRAHEKDLEVGTVLDRLCDDLRERGRIRTERPPNRELAEILVDEYVKFPPASVKS